jgi:PAS domain S-box-containing protein
MLGYSRDEVIGMNAARWEARIAPDELSKLIAQRYATNARFEWVTQHRCKDGQLLDVEMSGVPLELDGRPIMNWASRDVTERKRMELELRRSEGRFKATADVSP